MTQPKNTPIKSNEVFSDKDEFIYIPNAAEKIKKLKEINAELLEALKAVRPIVAHKASMGEASALERLEILDAAIAKATGAA